MAPPTPSPVFSRRPLSARQRKVLNERVLARPPPGLGGGNAGAPGTRLSLQASRQQAELFKGLTQQPDLILDGTDNFPTRYLINDWCRQQGIHWIYGGAVGTEGAAMVVTEDGSCLRCIWPTPPAQADVGNCETTGIIEPAIAAVTAFQSAEAIKLLLGKEKTQGVFVCDVCAF